MASVLKKSYGNRDFNLGELRNFRLHIYPTLAAMNADVSSAQARVAYCIETDRTYFGKTGAWVGLANATGWQDTVANVVSLPLTEIDGAVRVVLSDGTGVGPTIWVYSTAFPGWRKQADPGIVLANGTIKFTGIPGVSSGAVVPLAPTDLVTKAYADAGGGALAAHVSDPAAHAAAINLSTSTHDANGTAHAARFAATVASATADLNAHKIDGAAHTAVISAAVAAAIAAHDANNSAHIAEITSLITAHNTNGAAHPSGIAGSAAGGGSSTSASGGADGVLSFSGQNVVEGVCVVNGGHGTPCTTRPREGVYRAATEVEEPCGLIWYSSTQVAYGSGSISFDAATPKISIPSTSGLYVGEVVTFPSSVSNAGVHFTIVSIINGTDISTSPAPVTETVTSVMTLFARDGIVVFNGRFVIDRPAALGATAIQAMTASVGGKGRIAFAALGPASRIRPRDTVVVTGSVANNGSYIVEVVEASNSVLLTTVLPANQPSVAGTATFSHAGQANNFSLFALSTDKAKTWYADDSAGLKYGTTQSAWELGQQISSAELIVAIKRAEGTNSTINSMTPLTRKITQTVFVNAASLFTVTLFVASPGDEIVFIHSAGSLVTNNCTITASGGQLIAPANSTTYVMDTDGQSVTLKFVNGFWRLL